MTVAEVRAIGARTNNAELMVDCAGLGYLPEPVLDVTYEHGRFWNLYRPARLVTNDLDPATEAELHHDVRRLPFDDGSFATVVFDPPYKLNGTSTGKGPSASDASYGVAGEYRSVADKHGLINDGIVECARVASEFVLLKCMDQVCNGVVHWQTHLFTATAAANHLELVDMLHVPGYRKQPAGRRQIHARRDYSTLLVFAVKPNRTPV
jgi:hypothetical protein